MKNYLNYALNQLTFSSWMDCFNRSHLSEDEQFLAIKGLELHPEWVNQTNEIGDSALHVASYFDHEELLLALIKAGSFIDLKNKDGVTSLMQSVVGRGVQSLKRLIDAGADVNLQDQSGWTALHWAASRDNFDKVCRLIEAGANQDLRTQTDRTVLDWEFLDRPNSKSIMIFEYLKAVKLKQSLSQHLDSKASLPVVRL